MRYLIRYDFRKCQPQWSRSLAAAFGPSNDGVIVDADNERAAIEAFNAPRLPGQQFNPFYLEVKPQ